MKVRKLFGKFDIIIIAVVTAVLVLCSVPILFSEGDTVAEVYFDGEMIEEINLSENKEKREIRTGPDGKCLIEVDKDKIYFLDSDCPDKICIKSGKLERSGQFASCVPQKVTVILKGGGSDDLPDAVTY